MREFVEKFRGLDAVHIPGFKRITNCDEFYERIKALMSSARTVYIASLFFGGDGRMLDVLDVLEERKRSGLPTVIYVDKNRSCSLKGLEFAQQRGLMDMFHLVDFTTFKLIPGRLNEIFKVFHTKALVFDDVVLMSGANMDSSYMCNRIDRCLEVESNELAGLIRSKVFGVGRYEAPNFDMRLPVYVGMFKEHQEMSIVTTLLDEGFEEVHISTGYLNFPSEYLKMLNGKTVSLYASCPDVESFGAFGVLNRMIGPAYSYSFCRTSKCVPTLRMYEFNASEYTFHAKGIWGFKKNLGVTIVGSSNFNRRSVERDDEVNYLVVTSDAKYIEEMRSEVRYLRSNSRLRHPSELMAKKHGILTIIFFLLFNRFL